MKMVIADPSFEDWIGHHAPYDISILKAGASEGLSVNIWAAKIINNEFSEYTKNITKVYSSSAWGKSFASRKRGIDFNLILKLIALPFIILCKKVNNIQKSIRLIGPMLKELFRLALPPLIYDGVRKPITYIKFFTPPILLDVLRKVIPPIIPGFFTHTRWWIQNFIPPFLQDLLRMARVHTFEMAPKFSYAFFLRDSRIQYRETLKAIKEEKLINGDILFCHMITGYNFLVWALVARFCQKKGIKTKLLFRYPVNFIPEYRIDVRIAKRIYEKCVSVGLTEYYTDSKILSEQYRKFLNAPVQTLPIPHLPEFETLSSSIKHSKIAVAVLGNARAEKGFCEIVESLHILQKKGELDFEFHIQVNNPDAEAAEFINKIQEINTFTIHQYTSALSEDEYEDVLKKCDVVLVPYHAEVYEARTSGVLLEAISSAKIVVATKGTWLSKELIEYGTGVVVENKSAESIVNGLIAIRSRYQELRQEAITKSRDYRELHGAGQFLSCLIGNTKFGLETKLDAVIIFPFPDFFEQKSGATTRTGLLCEFLVSKGVNVSVVLPKQTIPVPHVKLKHVNFHEYNQRDGIASYLGSLKTKFSLFMGDYRTVWYINRAQQNINNIFFNRALNDAVRPNSFVLIEYPFDFTNVRNATSAYGNKLCLTLHDLVGLYGNNELLKSDALKLELSVAQHCDHVVTVAKYESDFLEAAGVHNILISNPCVVSYRNSIFRDKRPSSLDFDGSFVLFVGSNHQPNIKAAIKLREIAKHLAISGSKIMVVVAGTCHTQCRDGNFFSLGKIDDKTLNYLNKNCLMVVCPLEDGTGASLKTIQAMSYEKIVLGTHDAFRGLNVTNLENCIIEEKISNYYKWIIKVSKDYSKYRFIETAAFSLSVEYDYRKIYARYTDIIENA